MSRYRRVLHPGASYFFSLCLGGGQNTLLTDDIAGLRHAYAEGLQGLPVRTEAIVILPDHLHAVWTLPEGDADFPTRWQRIKTAFSRRHPPAAVRSRSMQARGEKGIWQRRYWEHQIRDEADLAAHVAYCWGNPVKHGLVTRAADWPYSSIHRDIGVGLVRDDWARPIVDGAFGEPAAG